MNSLKTLSKYLQKIFCSVCLPLIQTTDLEGNAPSQMGLETISIIVLVLTLWIYYFQSILLLFAQQYLGLFHSLWLPFLYIPI